MYRGRKQRFDWTFSLKVGDVVAVILSFPAAFALWGAVAPPEMMPAATPVTALNCVFYAVVILVFLSRFELYRWRTFIRFRALARRLPFALLASLATFIVIRLLVSEQHSPIYLPFLGLHLVVAFTLISGLRLAVRTIDSRILKGVSVERIAFVGWSKRLDHVLHALLREMQEFQHLEGFFYDGPDASTDPASAAGYKAVGPLDQLEQLIADREITLLLVDQGQITPREMRRIADLCADSMVTLRMIPSAFDIWANRLSVRVIAGFPVMGINDLHHDRYGNRVLKRLLDIACASFGLLVSAPVIAVLAVLIYRESPGPIFFRQRRLGLRGEPFDIIKLRSMRVDAESETGAVWAVNNDQRRLKIGAFMRSWNLDELPQFWNVLRGDMSMVGPRPERPEFVEGFRDTVRYYNLRHTCKPGVTGWAAVHGLRGNTSLEERLEYDLYYIENWSLLLDVKIMFMTLAPPRNAY